MGNMRKRRNKRTRKNRTRKKRAGKWVVNSRIITKRKRESKEEFNKRKKKWDKKPGKPLFSIGSINLGNLFSLPRGLYTKKKYKKYDKKMHNALLIPERWFIKGKSRTKKLFRWKKKKAKTKQKAKTKKKEKKLDDMTSKEMKKVGIRRKNRTRKKRAGKWVVNSRIITKRKRESKEEF